MRGLFRNRVAYLSLSFVLLLVSYPLISWGTTRGPELLWWLGLATLVLGAMIPPAQRLLFPPKKDAG